MKILILVLSHKDGGIYDNFYEAQKNTWDSEIVEDIETYYYFGNHKENKIEGKEIHLTTKETLMNCGKKTLECFEIIKEMEFDYIFRTNSSSYVDKKLLKEYLINKPTNNFYSGAIGLYQNISFASGCGYFMSRDLFELILKNKNKWNHNYIDDVSLGELLSKSNILPEPSSRFDVINNNNIPLNYFHYRLKTEKNRKIDIENMYKIKNMKDGNR